MDLGLTTQDHCLMPSICQTVGHGWMMHTSSCRRQSITAMTPAAAAYPPPPAPAHIRAGISSVD
jgi:hypothetical protein